MVMRGGILPILTSSLLLAARDEALAQSPGSFVQAGSTLVSAMMMFLGNEEKVYILDKTEGNAAQVDGHPAWGSVWDINSHQATVMAVRTNSFCASGMHLPNGSYTTFGGNGAISIGSGQPSSPGYDSIYGDYDGTKSIRILNPCTSSDDFSSAECQWFDDPAVLSMQKQRWYSAAEALGDGSIVLIGGFRNGGYVNRNMPNIDPTYEGGEQYGGAEPTYEFFPSKGDATIMSFMTTTSGLNSYAHTYLMPSGKVLVQANISTMLWDYTTNTEYPLPNMPGDVVRVYPASGAVAMLPLTPANNYTPTVLFCGGSDMPADYYGNYSWPFWNTWTYPASKDCQRLTPEPKDGSSPQYEEDDDMLEGRTMGQFITLPDGTMLVINGATNGTAGFSNQTLYTPSLAQMPFYQSLASGPVGTPAIYNPNAPKGTRWSNAGLSNTNIARMYHSSAMLLPDASVLVAGSNPNLDVNTNAVYPTQYTAEIFYPPYFSGVRPKPTGMPKTLSYGGNYFDLTVPSGSYSGNANDAAANTTVVLSRGGFTTHAMNMGQRHLQLNNTYAVNSDGSFVLHVSQAPPNANVLSPGPALLFVVVNGIPSNGTMVIVGSGQVGTQPISAAATLPESINSANGNKNTNSAWSTHKGAIIGAIVGGIVVIGILGALLSMCNTRRRRRQAQPVYAMGNVAGGAAKAYPRHSDSSAFVPLQQDNLSLAWNASTVSLQPQTPYRDGH
ncbi:putative copper radical oxidase [Hygrophoropsis aurantiaca]|uniref:Copper radical oxidase n=1 Tax=Hygrophoropsis aurantiaca TaxID=72124 RepID=A0ACB8A1W0_9AGAM|nr:putative copper radical oxidase [Hygrophoropsis aurantiaca]